MLNNLPSVRFAYSLATLVAYVLRCRTGVEVLFGSEIAHRIRVVIVVPFETRFSCYGFYPVIKIKLKNILSSIFEPKTELLKDFVSILERVAF